MVGRLGFDVRRVRGGVVEVDYVVVVEAVVALRGGRWGVAGVEVVVMVVLVVAEVSVLGGAQGSGLELVQCVEGQVVEVGVGEAKLVVVGGGGGHGWWGWLYALSHARVGGGAGRAGRDSRLA
jgi:hypothetical protein